MNRTNKTTRPKSLEMMSVERPILGRKLSWYCSSTNARARAVQMHINHNNRFNTRRIMIFVYSNTLENAMHQSCRNFLLLTMRLNHSSYAWVTSSVFFSLSIWMKEKLIEKLKGNKIETELKWWKNRKIHLMQENWKIHLMQEKSKDWNCKILEIRDSNRTMK